MRPRVSQGETTDERRGRRRLDLADELGIHYTSQRLGGAGGGPAGTIAYVMRANGTASLYRMCDGVEDNVRLSDARKLA